MGKGPMLMWHIGSTTHCFEVQQRVDGLCFGHVVFFIHLSSKFRSPLCDYNRRNCKIIIKHINVKKVVLGSVK